MKNILFILAFGFAFVMQACDNSGRPENRTDLDKVEPGQRESSNLNDAQSNQPGEGVNEGTTGTEMAYVCPMRCEGSASNQPGKCPVCKMDLVKNPNYREGTNARQGEVLNHESERADDRNMDDQLERQPR